MISVCLATYNGGRYLREQLASIVTQLGPGDEVVINDDASSDDTVAVIESFDDPRVRLEVNPTNLGYTGNFEAALTRSRGDLIFLADQDDVWLPGKVDMMLRELATADFVVSDAEVVDADLATLDPSHFAVHGTRTGFWHNFLATRYIGACMAFRRPVLQAALPFPARTDLCAHDYWLAIVAEAYFTTAVVRRPLMRYRRHGATASTGGAGSRNSLGRKVVVRLYCGGQLAGRGRRARRLAATPRGTA